MQFQAVRCKSFKQHTITCIKALNSLKGENPESESSTSTEHMCTTTNIYTLQVIFVIEKRNSAIEFGNLFSLKYFTRIF
jgi:hypothetical protein